MKHTPRTGSSRPLILLFIGCLAFAACFFAGAATPARAVSWQWKSVENRERLVIYLDAPGEAKVERSDRTAVTVTLPTTPQAVTQAPGSANPAANLVAKVDSQGRNLVIGLKLPAFGYITTTPNPRQVQIDFFADPLGARWKPKPGAEAKTVPAPQSAPPAQEARAKAAEQPKPPENAAQKREIPQPQRSGENAQNAPAPPKNGGLTERDITDVPPPTALDTLFNILAGDDPQAQNANNAPPAPEATPPTAPAPPAPPAVQKGQPAPVAAQEPTPVAPPAPAAPITATPPVAAATPAPAAPVQSTLVQEAAPAPVPQTSGASPQPVGGQAAAPAPATGKGASSFAFESNVNFDGPEEWDARAKTAAAPSPASTSAEPAETLEEVVKNPPAQEPMVSTTGQLAQAQANNIPPSQKPAESASSVTPAPETAAQNATAQAPAPERGQPQQLAKGQTAEQAQGEPAVKTPAEKTEAENGANKPGTTAAGQVFGAVEPSPEGAGHNATVERPESPEAKHGEEAAPEEPKLDENGNPIPPPPDPDKLLVAANDQLGSRNYDKALEDFTSIAALPKLTDEQREAALYGISDAQYGLGQDKLAEHFAQIVDATEKAMNFNLKSPRVPSLLLRLGFVNMKMDNVQEAEAYFNMLKRNYPDDSNIPLTYYYWGDYFFKHNDFRRASDQFQYIVQNYPDSRYVREASMGLARSLYNLGYYEQAYQVGEYIDRRWPRFYVEFPAVLTMFGDMAIRLNKLDDARRYYWTYFNIAPTGQDADTSLVHLGDIYMQQGKPDAAREVYQNAVVTFPKKDGGLIAEMRLVENGIHDSPLIPEMDELFDRGYNLRPMEVYTHIIKDFPESSLAPLATLKLAMWELWNKRYEDSIKTCEEFVAKYPKHALLPNVQDVIMAAFSRLTADSLPEANYERVVRAWDGSPTLRSLEERLTPEVRLSLSMSKANQNKSSDALADLDPFFRGAKDPEYGDSALTLALSTLVDNQSWDQIEPLAMRVAMWELKPETKAQLDYARALAFENRGQPEKALPLWEGLKGQNNLSPQLQAYTLYFLSRSALRNNDMENAYYLSRQALQSLSEIAEADPGKADTPKIKTLLGSLLDITESSGRAAEALEWYQQYAQYVKEGDEEWPSLRFRLAQLYKASGDSPRWTSILKELTEKYPNTLYGKMAASELQTNKLRENVSDFMPTGQ